MVKSNISIVTNSPFEIDWHDPMTMFSALCVSRMPIINWYIVCPHFSFVLQFELFVSEIVISVYTFHLIWLDAMCCIARNSIQIIACAHFSFYILNLYRYAQFQSPNYVQHKTDNSINWSFVFWSWILCRYCIRFERKGKYFTASSISVIWILI